MNKISCLILSTILISGCAGVSQAGRTDIDVVRYGADGKKLAEAHYSSGKNFNKIEAKMEKVGDNEYKASILAEGVDSTSALEEVRKIHKEYVGLGKDIAKGASSILP